MTTAGELSSADVQELSAPGAATLGESGAALIDGAIRPTWHGAAFAASAFTVACAPAHNLAIHVGVEWAPRRSVLAV